MGCRKSDIAKYRHDIRILEEAQELAQSVIDRQANISEDLTSLQTGYGSTVKASDDLIAEFHKLDEGAESDAASLKSKISEALEEARSQLCAAEREEESCPIHNPTTSGPRYDIM